MKIKLLNGRESYWTNKGIDWNAPSRSKLQTGCKLVLMQHWITDKVGEEVRVPGNKLYFDFVNFSKKIIVEVDGKQHRKFTPFFHKNNIHQFVGSMKRDDTKQRFADINEWMMLRVQNQTELQKYLAYGGIS